MAEDGDNELNNAHDYLRQTDSQKCPTTIGPEMPTGILKQYDASIICNQIEKMLLSLMSSRRGDLLRRAPTNLPDHPLYRV